MLWHLYFFKVLGNTNFKLVHYTADMTDRSTDLDISCGSYAHHLYKVSMVCTSKGKKYVCIIYPLNFASMYMAN